MPRQTRSKTVDYEGFVFWLRRPSAIYSLQEPVRPQQAERREHRALTFEAECLWPERFKGRVAEVQFTLPIPHANAEGPPAMGMITATPKRFELWGYLSPDALLWLATTAGCGLMTSLELNGRRVTPSRWQVVSAMFQGPSFDPVAYIG